jgi:hypothetical protein
MISLKLYNRLDIAKTGKLIYITLIDWLEGSEEEKVDLEELLGEIGVDDDSDDEVLNDKEEQSFY